MFKEIWNSIKNQFSFIYENILKFLINPICITLSLLSLYFFINCLIRYEIILAFLNLFIAIIFFKLFEERE